MVIRLYVTPMRADSRVAVSPTALSCETPALAFGQPDAVEVEDAGHLGLDLPSRSTARGSEARGRRTFVRTDWNDQLNGLPELPHRAHTACAR